QHLAPVRAAGSAHRGDGRDQHLPEEREDELRLDEDVDGRAPDLGERALGLAPLWRREVNVALVEVNDPLHLLRGADELGFDALGLEAIADMNEQRHRSAVDRRHPREVEVDARRGAPDRVREQERVRLLPQRRGLGELETAGDPYARRIGLATELDREALLGRRGPYRRNVRPRA